MKTVHAFKAQPVTRDGEHESLTIILDVSFPEGVGDGTERLRQAHVHFDADAKMLATALCDALPGGTLDSLLVELLKHKASSLVVPRGQ